MNITMKKVTKRVKTFIDVDVGDPFSYMDALFLKISSTEAFEIGSQVNSDIGNTGRRFPGMLDEVKLITSVHVEYEE